MMSREIRMTTSQAMRGNPTDGPIGSGFELDFYNAEVTQNNLGGADGALRAWW